MPDNFYETDKAISEYLLFHYGAESEFLEQSLGPADAIDFPARCGRISDKFELNRGRALDLGCAVGRASFELSRTFEEVIGIDFAHGLIDAGNHLARDGSATIQVLIEGELYREATIHLPDDTRPDRVTLTQGDAMNLSLDLGAFDFILLANLIDRLPSPRACLEGIHRFVTPGGCLAITSPYTWMDEYTPRNEWLGGFKRDGQPVHSIDSLHAILDPQFKLIDSQDMPFLIREHSRKNQYSVAHATVWKKTA